MRHYRGNSNANSPVAPVPILFSIPATLQSHGDGAEKIFIPYSPNISALEIVSRTFGMEIAALEDIELCAVHSAHSSSSSEAGQSRRLHDYGVPETEVEIRTPRYLVYLTVSLGG